MAYGILVSELRKVRNDMPNAWSYTMDAMQTFMAATNLAYQTNLIFLIKTAIGRKMGKTMNQSDISLEELFRFITPEIIAESLIEIHGIRRD